MWTVCITSISHVLKLNGHGGSQAKVNEKSPGFKGWETLVIYIYETHVSTATNVWNICLLKSPWLFSLSYLFQNNWYKYDIVSCLPTRCRINLFSTLLHEVIHMSTLSIQPSSLFSNSQKRNNKHLNRKREHPKRLCAGHRCS